jgi:hypothetical protein
VIIHGEYAGAGDYFLERLRRRLWKLSLVRMDKGTPVRYSAAGPALTLIGAAQYAADAFFASAEI